jgi:hypothetical protein
MTRRELSKELQTREAVEAIDSRREASIDAGFVDRDTKQTEPAAAAIANARLRLGMSNTNTTTARSESRESAKAESEVRRII